MTKEQLIKIVKEDIESYLSLSKKMYEEKSPHWEFYQGCFDYACKTLEKLENLDEKNNGNKTS